MRIRNLFFIVIGIVIVILIAVFGHRSSPPIAVRMQRIVAGSFRNELPESGTVQRPGTETIPTLIAGNLSGLYAKAGDHVTAGELLATIENPTVETNAAGSQADYDSAVANIATAQIDEQNAKVEYQAAVVTARSTLDLAQKTYDADVALYANKAIARQQLDTDKSKLDQARAQYEQALRQLRLGAVSGYGQNSVQYALAAAQKAKIVNDQNQLQVSLTRITAPFDGVIQSVATETNDATRTIQVGDPVTQGEALFTIARSDRYVVQAQVDEQDVINVRVGQYVQITGEDFPDQTIPGHVTAIAPTAVKSTDASSTAKQVLTTITLDRSPSFLKDGMTVDVDIFTTDLSHVIAVPSSAIYRSGGKPYVYVVERGRAAKRIVKTGPSNDTQTVILQGLAPGDRIVAEHQIDLAPGAAVTPQPSPSPEADD